MRETFETGPIEFGGTRNADQAGRWIRQGANIVIALDVRTSRTRNRQSLMGEVAGLDYTVCDFIDERISVEAQYALHAMLRDGQQRAVSLGILAAIKRGLLEGVLVQDARAAALKAIALGRTWWTLIPAGRDSLCVAGPGSRPPMIIFTKAAQNNRPRLMRALSAAWATCEVATLRAPAPRGTPCERPQPPPPPQVIEVPPEDVTGKPPCDEDVYFRAVHDCHARRIQIERECYDTFTKKTLKAVAKAGWAVGFGGRILEAVKQLPEAAAAFAEYRRCQAQAKSEWTRCLEATKKLKCP